MIIVNKTEAVVALSVCTLPTFCKLKTYIFEATRNQIYIQGGQIICVIGNWKI